MASLIPTVRTALGRYWSEIIGGAARRLNTADLFVTIRDRAAQLGLSTVGVSASAVSTLRGYAGRMLATGERINKAADTAILTSDHIAEAPWARPLQEQNAFPIWNTVIEHTIERPDGSTVTRNQTIVFTGTLPDTIGELRDQISEEARLLAEEGGEESEGTPKGKSLAVKILMLQAV